MNYTIQIVLAVTLVTACGGTKSDSKAQPDDARPAAAPLATPPIGVDSIKRMDYVWGDGRQAYEKAYAAYHRTKPRDWDAVRSNCEAAIAKDPHHLDAHRVLASALAQAGEHAAAVDHLVTALAGDYFKYGPSLAADKDLEGFSSTPHGAAINDVAEKIKAESEKRIASAMLLVGRRSIYRWPSKEGVQWSSSRGELYAFDRETRRYFRLTHTEHRVAGFARAASGSEVAVFGFEKIDRIAPSKDAAAPAPPPPTIAKSWLQVYETPAWKPVGKQIALPEARMITVGYGTGDRLLVITAPLTGVATTWSVDRTKGKLTKVTAALPPSRVEFTLEEGRQVRVPEGVTVSYSTAPGPSGVPTAAAFKTAGGATIRVPESGHVPEGAIVASPDGARVAFPTAVDPCAKDMAPSLYVADARTGALEHLLTAHSRFAARWLDPVTLAYEDGEGGIRLWDATSGREALRLENKAGIALGVLSLLPSPICKQAPPPEEPAGAGSGSGEPDDQPPMPPEVAPGGGPVTSPR